MGGRKQRSSGEAAGAVGTTSVGVGPNFYRRFGRDRKTFVSPHSEDFLQVGALRRALRNNQPLQHLLEPAPGTLTGDLPPGAPLGGWRCEAPGELDRAWACGPTKDPLVHRGLEIGRPEPPELPPRLPTAVLVLLSVPPARRHSAADRALLDAVQTLARLHHAPDRPPDELEALQRVAQLLAAGPQPPERAECRALVLQAALRKRRLADDEWARFLIVVGRLLDVDAEQVHEALDALRAGDRVGEREAADVRAAVGAELREQKAAVVPLLRFQRRVIAAAALNNRPL
ncbi:hypothetical protein M3Y99_01382700 [Aphelenchoides fujianensis]|nr:hypothetical protein M3Y99_01382700 [Aphelenchoides fujianensis]